MERLNFETRSSRVTMSSFRAVAERAYVEVTKKVITHETVESRIRGAVRTL